MPNSILTTAGLALFARAQAEGLTVTIDKMIFADVPNLDPEQTPDPAAGLPATEDIVFTGDIEYTGKIADDTVVYSRILAAADGDFYLNWIGLYSTEYETLVAICAVYRHKKYATDGFKAGNTLYKNFAIQYANASALTGIVIEAESWQFDLSARYALIDHNHDDRYEPKGAVAEHNQTEDPHPGKFEASGAVSDHDQAAGAHGRTGVLAASGYEKLPGGLIIQWGEIPITSNAVGSGREVTLVFPVSFPTAACSVSLMIELTAGAIDAGSVVPYYHSLSNDSVILGNDGNGASSVSRQNKWIALGY